MALSSDGLPRLEPYSRAGSDALRALALDRQALSETSLAYERLDQLTVEILLGVRS